MEKVIIRTEGAPVAIGPYSQGVRRGECVFTSGQMGLVPGTTSFAGDEIESQARRALENLRAVLEATGSGFEHVQKTTVYLVDPQDTARLAVIYAAYFPDKPPAGSTVYVAALPMGGRVQIEAVALDSDSTASDLVYTSGQTGVIYDSNRFAGDDIESQTRQTLTNLKAELEASGSCLENVLKTTVYLADVREFSRMNGVYAEFFREAPPARATVQPSALPDGARVQIEAVAYREG